MPGTQQRETSPNWRSPLRTPSAERPDGLRAVDVDRDSWAIGGQHKRAGVTGAAYSFQTITPLSRGGTGLVHIRVDKDRPGTCAPTPPTDASQRWRSRAGLTAASRRI